MKEMLKKITLVLMVLVLIFPNLIGIDNKVSAAGGSGTVADPFIISNHVEFNNIRNNLNAHYKLSDDINLSSYVNWVPIGGTFLGSLDGNGYKITGLNNTTNTSYRGLFYQIQSNGVNSGVIKNLTIKDANITGSTYTGILAGLINGTSNYKVNLENLNISGNVTSSNATYVGGVSGSANYVNTNNVITDIKLTSSNTYNYIGGFYGFLSYGNISNSVAKGSIISSVTSSLNPSGYGGLIGYGNFADINNVDVNVNISHNQSSARSTSCDDNGDCWTNYHGGNYMGGVVGQYSNSSIKNVTNRGYVRIGGGSNYTYFNNVGGVIGHSNTVNMKKVVNKGEVNTSYGTTNSYYYSDYVGGIIGNASNTQIYNTSNYGKVSFEYPSVYSSIDNYGGILGYGSGTSGNIARGSSNTLTISDTVNHGDVIIKNDVTTRYVGGLAGHLNYGRVDNSYSTGNVNVSYYSNSNNKVNADIGGFIGRANDNNNSTDLNFPNINKVYSSGDVITHNGGGSNYFASGLISFKQTPVTSSFYVGNNINDTFTNNELYRYGLFHSNGYTSSNNYYNSNQKNSVNANGSTGTYTEAQLKTWAPYSNVGWSNSKWNIEAGKSFPYLKELSGFVIPGNNLKEYKTGLIKLNYIPDVTGNESPVEFKVKIEKMGQNENVWTNVEGNFTTTDKTGYTFNIPKGISSNTKFRWKVAGKSGDGEWGDYYPQWTEFLFTNFVTDIKGTIDMNKKDFTTSLNKRTMNFSLDDVADPDEFSYLNLYAEIEEIPGSAKKVAIPSNIDKTGIPSNSSLNNGIFAPLSFGEYGKKEFKLKLIPNFSSTKNTYDIAVVESSNESNILATLVEDRLMQNISATSPEKFTFKFYMSDYQKEVGVLLSNSNEIKQEITIDTRNYLPALTNMIDDVEGRDMSMNQGFNKINFSGQVSDLDPVDNVDVHYTVKSVNDTDGGTFVVNPLTDPKVGSFKYTDYTEGISNGKFEGTYTVSDDLSTGKYVLLVYGIDSRGGIGELHEIPFNIDRSNPDIQFYAEVDGNILSTSARQVVTKPSKLKMYFSATDYVTFEYASYLIKPDQQKSNGNYVELPIRGSFTNDIDSSFIGIDLLEDTYSKGDILVFKFRAIAATGEKMEKDIRIVLGDENTSLSILSDEYLPVKIRN